MVDMDEAQQRLLDLPGLLADRWVQVISDVAPVSGPEQRLALLRGAGLVRGAVHDAIMAYLETKPDPGSVSLELLAQIAELKGAPA